MSLRLSGGRRLQSPPGEIARPTAARVRQAVLNLLQAELPGCRWLDLCCGSGVMACEALQRGAAEVVAIERDRRVAAVARANLEAVAGSLAAGEGRPRLRVIQADARRWLAAECAPGIQGRGRSAAVVAPSPGSEGLAPGVGGPELQGAVPEGAGSRRSGSTHGDPVSAVTHTEQRAFDLIYCDPPWPAGLHGPLSEAVLRGGWISPVGTLVWECPSDEVPSPPPGWLVRDQRRYGGSTVMLLTPDGGASDRECDGET